MLTIWPAKVTIPRSKGWQYTHIRISVHTLNYNTAAWSIIYYFIVADDCNDASSDWQEESATSIWILQDTQWGGGTLPIYNTIVNWRPSKPIPSGSIGISCTHLNCMITTQSCILSFLNALVQTTSDPNEKVYHQQEILRAGFDPELVEQVLTCIMCSSNCTDDCLNQNLIIFRNHVYRSVCNGWGDHLHTNLNNQYCFTMWHHVQSLHGRRDERILHELQEWDTNYVNVQQLLDDLLTTRGRVSSLTEEVRNK